LIERRQRQVEGIEGYVGDWILREFPLESERVIRMKSTCKSLKSGMSFSMLREVWGEVSFLDFLKVYKKL